MDIQFRQGIISAQEDTSGNLTFLRVSNGVYVDQVCDNAPIIFTVAHFEENYLIELDQSLGNAWGPLPGAGVCYLFWNISLHDGSITYGYTQLPPTFGPTPPANPIVGQHWFDTHYTVMKVWDGVQWGYCLRVFAGTYANGILTPNSFSSQAGIIGGSYTSGYIVFDVGSMPLVTAQGSFATTASEFTVGNANAQAVKLEAIPVYGKAAQPLPAYTLVSYSAARTIQAANFANGIMVNGIITKALNPGEVGQVIFNGKVSNPLWNFPSSALNKPIYTDGSGHVTLVAPTIGLVQILGYVYDQSTVIMNIQFPKEPPIDFTRFITTGPGLQAIYSPNSVVLELNNSGVTAGTYGDSTDVPVITVGADGRITNIGTIGIHEDAIITLAGDVSGSGMVNTTISTTLATTGVTAGSYQQVTVDNKGRVLTGSNPTTLSGYGITDAQPLNADLSAITNVIGNGGTLVKNASGNWSLNTGVYLLQNEIITITGDATGTGSTSIILTLANSGVTQGTYTQVVVDTKGRVIGGQTPTTLSGYGITDALTMAQAQAAFDLRYSSINRTYTLAALADVNLAAPANGQFLVYNATDGRWENSSFTYELAFLGDVTLTSPQNGQMLVFENGAWVNQLFAFSSLTDIPSTIAGYGIIDAAPKTGIGTSGTWPISISGNSVAAVDIVGGLPNEILYQSAVGVTGFIQAPSTSNVVLEWNGSSFLWTTVSGLVGGASPVQSVNGLTGSVILTSTNITEGNNLYFTTARAANAAPVQSVNGQTGAVLLNTNNITEGNNLYFTTSRAATAAPVQSVNGQTGAVCVSTTPSLLTSAFDASLANNTGFYTCDINFSGDFSGSFSGTGTSVSPGSLTMSLRPTGVAAGTYNSVTVDTLGRVTSASNIGVSFPVNSVNGCTGTVTLTADAIPAGTTNKYFSNALAAAAAPVQSVNGLTGAVTVSVPVQSVNGQTGAVVIAANTYTAGNSLVTIDGSNCICVTDGYFNTTVGSIGFGITNTSFNQNCNSTTLGYQAFQNATGAHNTVVIGSGAGSCLTVEQNNTIIGRLPGVVGACDTVWIGAGQCERLKVNSVGLYINGALVPTGINANCSVAFGNGLSSSTGLNNIAIGQNALLSDTTGAANIAIGTSTLQANITGCSNIAIGTNALLHNTTGVNNIAIGNNASANAVGSSGVTAIGLNALNANIVDFNTAIGTNALASNTSGTGNLSIGACSLAANTFGVNNTALGYQASASTITGNDNVSIGFQSLCANTIGSYNVGIGAQTLVNSVSASNNIAIGYQALCANTCSNNIAIGTSALSANANGYYNLGIGAFSLQNNTAGLGNLALGAYALRANTTGATNTGIGFYSLATNTVGNNNVAIGPFALNANLTGSGNTAIGFYASDNIIGGSCNVMIGYCTGHSVSTGSNNVLIGATLAGTSGMANTVIIAAGPSGCMNSFCLSDNGVISIGNCALGSSVGIDNIAIGRSAMASAFNSGTNAMVAIGTLASSAFVCGGNTTALGYGSLSSAVTSYSNTAVGALAMTGTTCAFQNTAVGVNALTTSNGINNTAVGYFAGCTINTGTQNTAFGSLAFSSGDYSNSTAIGFSAQVTGSNQVQLGNSSTTTYAYGTVQNRSDCRDKAEIRDTILGLNFVNALRPVDFKWNYREDYDGTNDGSKVRQRYHHGLIAQELRDIAAKCNIDFGGLQDHSIAGGQDVLTIGYDELIAPLIKAVQEQSKLIEDLTARIMALESK